MAAIQDKYADASVGNVTGSNAVNVFLGIGIAWSIAAVHHALKGEAFKVDPGKWVYSLKFKCGHIFLPNRDKNLIYYDARVALSFYSCKLLNFVLSDSNFLPFKFLALGIQNITMQLCVMCDDIYS